MARMRFDPFRVESWYNLVTGKAGDSTSLFVGIYIHVEMVLWLIRRNALQRMRHISDGKKRWS